MRTNVILATLVLLACTDRGDVADAGSTAGPVTTDSAFGVFAVFTEEFSSFRQSMGMDVTAYQDWAGGKMSDLGARWSRSNLQLIWDKVEPTLGGAFDWSASFGGDSVFAAAARHNVRYLAVFHLGGGGTDAPLLRDPCKDLAGWKRFAQAVAERYDGDGVDDAPGGIVINDFQIGNEISQFTGSGRTAADYVNWFEAASQAIREANPRARLVVIASTDAARVDPFHQTVIAGLAARGVRFDAIDLHHWGSASAVSGRMAAVPDIKAALATAKVTGVEIWSMEHGTYVGQPAEAAGTCNPACQANQVCASIGMCVPRCASNATCPVLRSQCDTTSGQCKEPAQTQQDQARSLVYRYAMNRSLGVALIDWNNLVGWRCFGGRCGSYFDLVGLVVDGNGPGEVATDLAEPRLSYLAYRMLAALTDQPVAEVTGEVLTGDATLHVYSYRHRTSGRTGLVAWADASKSASLAWAVATAHVVSFITDASGSPLRTMDLTAAQGQITLTLDADPVWIGHDATW